MRSSLTVATRSVLTVALTLLVGCGVASFSVRGGRQGVVASDPARVSEEQVEQIAAAEATRRGLVSFALRTGGLVERRYWRIVAESIDGASTRYTNVVPAVVSAEQAAVIACGDAKTTFNGAPFKIHPVELLQGAYWNVIVEQMPPCPGGFFVLVISATDGEVVTTIPGM